MDSHKETGCQVPEGPILCVNNCGFFGSAATMNMCSKCHKVIILKQEHAKLAASSIGSIVNDSLGSNGIEPMVTRKVEMQAAPVVNVISTEPSTLSSSSIIMEVKPKEGPSRCGSCRKRVGLTGFTCRCDHMFCAAHRYSDKHNCPYDYRAAGQNAVAKANPVIKAEKLDKI